MIDLAPEMKTKAEEQLKVLQVLAGMHVPKHIIFQILRYVTLPSINYACYTDSKESIYIYD